jgi:geranylgeranyl diphosphate synthase type I
VHETTRLAGLLQERITDRINEHRRDLAPLGPDAIPLLDEAANFLIGGKRFRAQFAILGYRAIQNLDFTEEVISSELDRLLDAACSLELFHAAALIHDDIIDRSDTRRGRPSAHRHFASHHTAAGWSGIADQYGVAAAILLGDLLQSWADELMQGALDATPNRDAAKAARAHFNRMRSEVAVGQYLDVVEEQQSAFAADNEQLERSTRVLVYKSAKYSVEAPLLIGAALAGANSEQEQALAEFGLPIGVAFQLRDDVLGVFGNEELTGKPAGDDLTEGKRTVLVTLARQGLPAGPRRIFDDMHGTPDLSHEQIVMLQRTIRDSGALDRVEDMIAQNVALASRTISDAPICEDAAHELGELATRTSLRHA